MADCERILVAKNFTAGVAQTLTVRVPEKHRQRIGGDEYVKLGLDTVAFEFDAKPGTGTRNLSFAAGNMPITKQFPVEVRDEGTTGGGVDVLGLDIPVKLTNGDLELSFLLQGSDTVVEFVLSCRFLT